MRLRTYRSHFLFVLRSMALCLKKVFSLQGTLTSRVWRVPFPAPMYICGSQRFAEVTSVQPFGQDPEFGFQPHLSCVLPRVCLNMKLQAKYALQKVSFALFCVSAVLRWILLPGMPPSWSSKCALTFVADVPYYIGFSWTSSGPWSQMG